MYLVKPRKIDAGIKETNSTCFDLATAKPNMKIIFMRIIN